MDKKEDKIYSKLSDGFPSANYLYLSLFVSRNIDICLYLYTYNIEGIKYA